MTRVLLNLACVLTLVALALMVWSILVPHVWPIMIAMSVAQGLGTLAFAMYGYVVFRDVRRRSIVEPAQDRFGIRAELEKDDPIEEKVDEVKEPEAPKATEAHAS